MHAVHMFAAIALAALVGCRSVEKAGVPGTPPPDPRAVTILRGTDGSPVDFEALASAASGAEAVIIGENHGHALGLAFAAALFDDVVARTDRAALSMEFFERDQQAALDDYLAGLTDETAFKKAAGRTASNYPPGHRDMVEAAKAAKLPVYAANNPRVYNRAASRHGYERLESLTAAQRRLFRIPDELPTGRYRADFDKIMDKPHTMPGAEPKEETPEEKTRRIDNGFRSQSLWDWTMAETVADALDEKRAPVVHVVGRFHSDFRGGLIQALEKLRPGTGVLTISVIPEWSDTLRDDDRDRADFVVYVGPFPEPG